jgi:hypothetical protein
MGGVSVTGRSYKKLIYIGNFNVKFSVENLIKNWQNKNTSTQNPLIDFFTVVAQAFLRTTK